MAVRIVISVALLAWGCGDREATTLAHIKTVVCACKDTKCAEAALKDVPQGEAETSHRSRVIARDMLDCLAKLYAAERPSTDPDAPPVVAPEEPQARTHTP